MIFRASRFKFSFPRPALIVGIVNITPDSFSDGGRFLDKEKAVAHALKLVEQGADIIDVGGESTRPGSDPVGEAEELRRVIPVIKRLSGSIKVPISIDTMKPNVARAALEAGASIVNDIAANRSDEAMWRLVAETKAGYVCMHMQGTPKIMQTDPIYGDVVVEVKAFFEDRMKRFLACGIDPEQIVFDVGIGFGKTLDHNLGLLASLDSFACLDRPLLLGVSHKSFIKKLLGTEVEDRLPASLACACLAVESGVEIIRTHDVKETVQAIRMTEAIIKQKT